MPERTTRAETVKERVERLEDELQHLQKLLRVVGAMITIAYPLAPDVEK